MAEAGASPTLAAGTIDSAIRAPTEAGVTHEGSRAPAARASLIEGYVGAVRDAERITCLATWEYPACVVELEDGAVAIACGYPTEDGEALAEWAARVAGRVVKAGARRAVLAGSESVKSEVASALALVGVEVVARSQDDAKSARRGWLRLPWRK
jgi:hypothetical protein